MNLDVFRGRRVLITGDTGFKGSWLALWLQKLGASVCGASLPPAGPKSHFSVLSLGRLIEHHDVDIRDGDALRKVCKQFRPEFLFHLAAQSLVSVGYQEAGMTFDTNVMGSLNVLECARELESLRVLVYVTSDKCYRNHEWPWGYRENDELGGRDPYSASKACAELLLTCYRESFLNAKNGLGVASVRAGNVIGGGDWALNRIVPDCFRAIEGHRPLVLRNPAAIRPWQHVLEPLGGYLHLATLMHAEPGRYSGAWNFGPAPASSRPVLEVAREFFRNFGAPAKLIEVDERTSIGHETGVLRLNCDRAHHDLGWRPKWDFAATMRETADWYQQYHSGADACRVSEAQIGCYQQALAAS